MIDGGPDGVRLTGLFRNYLTSAGSKTDTVDLVAGLYYILKTVVPADRFDQAMKELESGGINSV